MVVGRVGNNPPTKTLERLLGKHFITLKVGRVYVATRPLPTGDLVAHMALIFDITANPHSLLGTIPYDSLDGVVDFITAFNSDSSGRYRRWR